jgi:hypothetical protein
MAARCNSTLVRSEFVSPHEVFISRFDTAMCRPNRGLGSKAPGLHVLSQLIHRRQPPSCGELYDPAYMEPVEGISGHDEHVGALAGDRGKCAVEPVGALDFHGLERYA